MAHDFDLVIRKGQLADGSGGRIVEADVAVKDGRIAAVGKVAGSGAEEIDARGLLVTPGFVDVHTHYDGQVTWENRLIPSSGHGVTTVLMGNCGVGFAPCRPHQRDMLLRLMEGVEDIPEVVMTEGLPWNWESFSDYLDVLATRTTDIDFAAYVPHAPIRIYVMGERGEQREPATEMEMAAMTEMVRQAIAAGAIGVSTSRHIGHRTRDGVLAATVGTPEEELMALARGVQAAGRGVFQLIPNSQNGAAGDDPEAEFAMIRRIAETTGGLVTFSLLQKTHSPTLPRDILNMVAAANRDGLPIKAQIFPRPIGILMGLDVSLNPFRFHPSYQAIADRPLAERVAALRDPSFRAKLLAEQPVTNNPTVLGFVSNPGVFYALGSPPNYEPKPEDRISARAERMGITAHELALDLMLEQDGRELLLFPVSNYADGSLDMIREMMVHPDSLIALGDGGAHYGMICDSSFPTFMLTHWTRHRDHGRVPLEWVVKALSRDNALAIGLRDRGLVAPGLKADLNIIDYDRLRLHTPMSKADLPAGGRRLSQRADGYRATVVSGQVTYRDGEATGTLPGRLIRSSQVA